MFYLASALAMPLREAYLRLRKRSAGGWRTVLPQFAIASGILGGIWTIGWLLGRVLAAARPLVGVGVTLPPIHVLGRVSIGLAFGTLALVLGGVEVLRLFVHPRPALPRQAALDADREPLPLPEERAAREWHRAALLLALGLAVGTRALAQSVDPHLARADSAWGAGDSALAAREFAAVLAGDPYNSHATFRLAQLTRDNPAEALRLFRRYVELEPTDAWGYLAVADALAKAGQYGNAVDWYDRALSVAPEEPEAIAGRSRALARARLAAPAITPLVGRTRDSDGNTTERLGASVELGELRHLRFGVEAARDRISDGVTRAELQQLALRARWRPRPGTSLDVAAGGTRLDSIAFGGSVTVMPTGRVRARWRSSAHGPALDVRAQRGVVAASPQLVANRVVRTELGVVGELPFARSLKLRGIGRNAALRDSSDVNHRTTLGGIVAAQLSPVVEVSGGIHQIRYAHATTAGYFAPRLIQIVEAGTYLELESDGGWLLSLDAGAGAQRVADQGGPVGPWSHALRGYALIVAPLTAGGGRALQLELEGEDSAVAREAVTAGQWRYGSVALSLRWAL
jgi:hypothetical protein